MMGKKMGALRGFNHESHEKHENICCATSPEFIGMEKDFAVTGSL